ncbi:outer membrane beta-barrel protein [Flammeovirga sp. SubArs3]|uniref:outer membrane beta-barrel protein n=1 Tax=Flammeovirga sp. SubArs3 TaxID=2995316 RepID=UPI00248B8839|nr:outer membrane beta-barrel protein [Flammeovirga sp. SubArs3]
MKKLSLIFFCIVLSYASFGQGALSKIPGNFYVDFGLTFWEDDSGLPLESQSRSISISYMYEFSLSPSGQFTFNPGLGYTGENLFFKSGMTLTHAGDQTIATPTNNLYDNTKKSKLVGNYFDLPVEFRFRTYPGRNAFRFALGAKVGVLMGGHTKVKYEDNGETRIAKDKGEFNLNRFKASLVGRIGYGWINFFCTYGLTNTFQDNTLVDTNGNLINVKDRPITVGITISNF